MNDKLNGSGLEAQPSPPSRGTCQQCRFGQVSLGGGNAIQPVCKRMPPRPVACIVQVEVDTPAGRQITQQWATNAYVPSVGKDDWCGEWQQDPNAIRSGASSVLASASDKPS